MQARTSQQCILSSLGGINQGQQLAMLWQKTANANSKLECRGAEEAPPVSRQIRLPGSAELHTRHRAAALPGRMLHTALEVATPPCAPLLLSSRIRPHRRDLSTRWGGLRMKGYKLTAETQEALLWTVGANV